MALPESAEPYWVQQQAISATAVAVALRAWQNSGGNPARWAAALPLVMAAIMRAQVAAALAALGFVATVVRDLSLTTSPLGVIDPAPLIGLSGAGLPLQDLYAQLPNQLALKAAAAARVNDESLAGRGVEPLTPGELERLPAGIYRAAMEATALQLRTHVQTAISDTGRAAESLEIAVRPGLGYVRMLNPPACKRCVILAGKFYEWNAGFERHPGCDCRHLPAKESVADQLRVDPKQYFRSLTVDEQNSAFGKAGAQAIRDGADMAQVVNADQGMQVAQVYGQALKITTQGVTKRGRAGRAIRARGRNPATTPRLMPSSIYQIAKDREDAVRLLAMNGYIADANDESAPNPRTSAPDIVDLDAEPAAAGGISSGPPRTPPPQRPVPTSGAPDDEPRGWTGHTKNYVHPHRALVWSEAERVRRQAALGVVPDGEQLRQHEIEGVERLLAAGQSIQWLPLDTATKPMPTNDFLWANRGGRPGELKSTKAKYSTIKNAISGAVSRAMAADRVKDVFVVDIGGAGLSPNLERLLKLYNVRNPAHPIAELWVISRGRLMQVDLQ